jgi:hypothetical protein
MKPKTTIKMQLLQQGAEFYCDGLINLTEHWLKHEYNRSDYVENCARVQNRIKEKHLFLFQRNISYRYEEETRTYYISARPRKIPFEKKKKKNGCQSASQNIFFFSRDIL